MVLIAHWHWSEPIGWGPAISSPIVSDCSWFIIAKTYCVALHDVRSLIGAVLDQYEISVKTGLNQGDLTEFSFGLNFHTLKVTRKGLSEGDEHVCVGQRAWRSIAEKWLHC
jgi:hypothetical protein